MIYKIGDYQLDTIARTLTSSDGTQKIRPKTLALLLYLGEKQGKIISKQQLLNEVWDDVQVDDGVIFQSVREVRKLFNDAKIIINYPRKGYEFTQSLRACDKNTAMGSEAPAQIKLVSSNLPKDLGFKGLVVALVLFTICFIFYFSTKSSNQYNGFEQNIVVLPIKNKVPYGDHAWVYLGGMEQLIAKLQGLPNTVYIHQGIDVPRLMHIAGLTREYQTSDIGKLFSTTGATLIVETEMYGATMDYKLVYKLHMLNDTKQGVILDASVEDALQTLAGKIADLLQQPIGNSHNQLTSEFSDTLFAQAIINHESDWESSISFFESYLALNPDSIIAGIYLTKLYLWNGHIEKAQTLINKTASLSSDDQKLKGHTKLIQAILASEQQQWEKASEYFNQAEKLIEELDDFSLKIPLLEEQGRALEKQELLTDAMDKYRAALSLNKVIKNTIGININRLNLANLYFQMGDKKAAKENLILAKQEIETKELDFLYGLLAESEQRISLTH